MVNRAIGRPIFPSLRVSEIFYSIQGESRTVGCPAAFVRLSGCPLRCNYCDTAYSFQGGERMGVADILSTVAGYQTQWVTVTGGEPLVQESCLSLLTELCQAGYQVSLETSGAMDISRVGMRVSRVMDLKTPGSGEVDKNLLANIEHLRKEDQVKFVLCDRADYQWAKDMLVHYDLATRCEVLFSPAYNRLNTTNLAGWILQDRLPVRLQIQLHKYLWGEERGR